jgi:hypothetical protein
MWSRHFLAVGLASAAAIAVASSTLMWLIFAGFAGSGHFKLESITIPATVGLIGYPSSWYFVVYRAGNWSGGRIIVLVMLTYLVSFLLVALGLGAYGAHHGVASQWGSPMLMAFSLAGLGALLLAFPYAAVATPMAFWHRHLVMSRFAGANESSRCEPARPLRQGRE